LRFIKPGMVVFRSAVEPNGAFAMKFDLATLGTVSALTGLFQVLMMLLMWWMSRRLPGIGLWALCVASHALAFPLAILRVLSPWKWLTILVPNLLFVVGAWALLQGMAEFLGVRLTRWLLFGLGAVFLTLSPWFIYGHPSLPVRFGLAAALALVVHGWVVKLLLAADRPDERFALRCTAWFFSALMANDSVRLLLSIFWPDACDFTRAPAGQATVFLAAIVFMPMTSMAFALLIGQRQLNEIRVLERRHQEAIQHRGEERLSQQRLSLLRDLHDGLAGAIASISVHSDLLDRSRDEGGRRDSLRIIQAMAKASSQEIRALISTLDRQELAWHELLQELREYAEGLAAESNIRLDWRQPPCPVPLLDDIAAAVSLSRALKEAIRNLVRHSGTREACVSFHFHPHEFEAWISDEGNGFPADMKPGKGLASLRRRACELGGEVGWSQLHGVTVHFRLPLPLRIQRQDFQIQPPDFPCTELPS